MFFLDSITENVFVNILVGILVFVVFISFLREKRSNSSYDRNPSGEEYYFTCNNIKNNKASKIADELRQNIKPSKGVFPIQSTINYVQKRMTTSKSNKNGL